MRKLRVIHEERLHFQLLLTSCFLIFVVYSHVFLASSQVVSGGVASNEYILKVLQIVTEANGLSLNCPPPKLCTDNGIMIAW